MKSYHLFYFMLIIGFCALYVNGAPSLNSNSKSSANVLIAVDDDISSKHTSMGSGSEVVRTQVPVSQPQTNPILSNLFKKLNIWSIQS